VTSAAPLGYLNWVRNKGHSAVVMIKSSLLLGAYSNSLLDLFEPSFKAGLRLFYPYRLTKTLVAATTMITPVALTPALKPTKLSDAKLLTIRVRNWPEACTAGGSR